MQTEETLQPVPNYTDTADLQDHSWVETGSSPLCTSSVVAPCQGFTTSLYTTTSAANSCPNVPMLRNQPRLLSDFTCAQEMHFLTCAPLNA